MMYYLKLAFVLLVIAGLASATLAYLNGKTQPIIEANKKLAELAAREKVLPGASAFERDSLAVEGAQVSDSLEPLRLQDDSGGGMFFYYRAYDKDHNLVGYIFTALGKGYSSTIQTMCGVVFADDGALELNAIEILYQGETPGLGANAVNDKFLGRFNGLSQLLTTSRLYVDKDGGDITSITGATITTRAIVNSIREGMNHLPAPPVSEETPEPIIESAPVEPIAPVVLEEEAA
ncbi:MAG: FMN-binding protein [Candidatus Cloacimonetes bacterium]|nr:FMN-binding protein [Candidatus Cloacimonadota bacterium]